MMPFDLEAARKAGKTDDEIADYLGKQLGFDIEAAKRAGKSSKEIVDYLAITERPEPKPAKDTTSLGVRAAQEFPGSLINLLGRTEKALVGYPQNIRQPLQTWQGGPRQTLQAYGNIIAGGAESLFPGGPTPEKQAFSEFVRPVTRSIQDPSSILPRLGEYIATDPASALSNLALGLSAFGKAAEIGGGAAGKLPKAAGLRSVETGELPTLEKTTQAGGAAPQLPSPLAAFGRQVQQVGKLVDPLNLTFNIAGDIARIGGSGLAHVSGFTTGKGYPNIRLLHDALQEGGPMAEEARQYLRGRLDSQSVVAKYVGDLEAGKKLQMGEYQSQLRKLSQNPSKNVDMSAVQKTFDEYLQSKNIVPIKDKKGRLTGRYDYERSPLKGDEGAQRLVTELTNHIKQWGSLPRDRSPFMMDTLRVQMENYLTRSKNPTVQELIENTKGHIDDAIEAKSPGYKKTMANFDNWKKTFDDSKKMFGQGDPKDLRANADTVLKKLSTALREDPDYRRNFLSHLEQKTGRPMSQLMAAYEMSGWLPSGLVGRALAGSTFYRLFRGTFDPHLLTLLMLSSPRIAGEFMNVMAYGERGARTVAKGVEKTAVAREVAAGTAKAAEREQARTNPALDDALNRYETAKPEDRSGMTRDISRMVRTMKREGVTAAERRRYIDRWNRLRAQYE